MLGGLLFRLWRVAEIITLIPVIGMLSWFVHIFNKQNQLTPDYILTLFIVSILACAWAIATLFRMSSTRRSALFVAFIDLCFVGGFIAADYLLRGIGHSNCANFSTTPFSVSLGPYGIYSSGNPLHEHVDKTCAMLKASWIFGIMNTIFFFITFLLAILLHRHERTTVVKETRVRRSRHGSRRGHSSSSRRHSSSRRYYV